MTNGQQLLAEYVTSGSETAFRELVSRYVNLVYSAAIRLVNGDAHLAEDVTQTVFADLARKARTLSREVMLGGWLHRHTCFVAGKTMRSERRRQARERQSVEMNAIEDHSAANLAMIAPVLDEAINQLGPEDRAAVMLRFFEQHDFRSVGEAMGSTEEAARKRVDRALEKLESVLKQRGIALSATALGATLATQAVTAAPAGLALTISTTALATVAGGSTTLTVLEIMSMTKLKIGIISAIVVAGVSIPWVMQHQAKTQLRAAQDSLRQQEERIGQLTSEKERLASQVTRAVAPAPASNSPALELLRLRGEVSRLRRENLSAAAAASEKTNGPSALSGLTANPEMWKLIRNQQKGGLTMVYKDLAKRLNLAPEQSEKLADVLADNVMENIDHITAVLRDGKGPEQMDQLFAAQEAVLLEKVKELLGPDGLAQYQEYTKNLASSLTAEQFKPKLTGEATAKDEKSKQLYQLMLEETQQVLASAGLPADYQTVPTLNFRNIASEAEGEKNLKILDSIYERVAARAGTILNAEELTKFAEFRTIAINNNRMVLTLNRKLMAPSGK